MVAYHDEFLVRFWDANKNQTLVTGFFTHDMTKFLTCYHYMMQNEITITVNGDDKSYECEEGWISEILVKSGNKEMYPTIDIYVDFFATHED